MFLDLRELEQAATQIQGEPNARQTIEIDLTKALPLVANYDPWQYQERFKKIAELLQSK